MSATASIETREKRCEKHGLAFFEMHIERLDVWTGTCPECSNEQRLQSEARSILATRDAEQARRVGEKVSALSANIEQETNAAIERHLAACAEEAHSERHAFEAYVRQRIWESCTNEVESEMLAEIIETLRKG